jgi:hypothetical protein
MIKIVNLILAFSLMLHVSCGKQKARETAAENKLKEFIKLSTSLTSAKDKGKMKPYLYGKMEKDIETMGEGEFDAKFIKPKIELKNIEIMKKDSIDSQTVEIRYNLNYTKNSSTQGETTVETEKVAQMVLDEGVWKIAIVYELSTKYTFPETKITSKGVVF